MEPTGKYTSELLQGLCRRDRAAQEVVFRAEAPTLRALGTRILGSGAEAEDLVGTLFVDFFFSQVDEIRHPAGIPGYLRSMLVRRARKLRSRRSREGGTETEALLAEADAAEGLEERADRARFLAWLAQCLEALTPKTRQVLKLQFGLGLSLSEAGEWLGVTKQAAGKASLRAMESLRACIGAKQASERRGSNGAHR